MSVSSATQEPKQYPTRDAVVCQACGNSPTNHVITYCSATIDIWQGMIVRALSHYRFFRPLDHFVRRFSHALERFNFRLWHRLGLINYNSDPTRAKTYRSQVVWEEARRRGIPMEQLVFWGAYTDIYRAHMGEWIYFESLPIPHHLEQSALQWIDDKLLLYRILHSEGIPVPSSVSVTSARGACAAFAQLQGMIVVKPRSGSRGRHTTTRIATEEEVVSAFRSAQRLCRYVLISRHLQGSVCRGTVVNGKLVGFFQADPARVTGDGVSTIQELVRMKNTSRHERVHELILNEGHADFVRRLGYRFDSVIEKGKVIDLSHWTGRILGGETRELLETVHPALKAHLERAAQVLQVPVVGFDLIIENPEAHPDTQEWGIIEANSLPFIDLHYLPLYGTPSNVASHVWDLWNLGEGKRPSSTAAQPA
ncbi:MAG: hypothetical protein AAB605_03715 [Patescibacteria group bacterium]